jgi:hypothetical protein
MLHIAVIVKTLTAEINAPKKTVWVNEKAIANIL